MVDIGEDRTVEKGSSSSGLERVTGSVGIAALVATAAGGMGDMVALEDATVVGGAGISADAKGSVSSKPNPVEGTVSGSVLKALTDCTAAMVVVVVMVGGSEVIESETMVGVTVVVFEVAIVAVVIVAGGGESLLRPEKGSSSKVEKDEAVDSDEESDEDCTGAAVFFTGF